MKVNERILAGALLLCLASARPAAAWDRETHRAALRAALAVSPALRARIPESRLLATVDAAGKPDYFDADCRTHHAPPSDPAREVARALEEIRARRAKGNASFDPLLVGKLLHYAADVVVPRKAWAGMLASLAAAPNDIVVFRSPRPIAGDVAEELRRRVAESRWADDSDRSLSSLFRDAVNLTADVGLLLPPLAPDPPADRGPVLVATRRVFNVAGKVELEGVVADYDAGYTAFFRALSPLAEKTGHYPVFAHRDVHVLELVPHTEGKSRTVRALLLNNQGLCEHHEILGNAKWFAPLPAGTRGLTLRTVEVQGEGDEPEKVFALGTRGSCAASAPAPGEVSLEWIQVYLLKQGEFPAFSQPTAECHVAPPPVPAGRYDVDFDLAAVQQDLRGAFLSLLQVRTEKEGWVLTTELMPRWDVEWVAMPLLFEIEATGAGAPVRYTARIDARRSEDYLRFETAIPERTARFQEPRFRLVSIRPDLRPANRKDAMPLSSGSKLR